jgi:hypothetical protein
MIMSSRKPIFFVLCGFSFFTQHVGEVAIFFLWFFLFTQHVGEVATWRTLMNRINQQRRHN